MQLQVIDKPEEKDRIWKIEMTDDEMCDLVCWIINLITQRKVLPSTALRAMLDMPPEYFDRLSNSAPFLAEVLRERLRLGGTGKREIKNL